MTQPTPEQTLRAIGSLSIIDGARLSLVAIRPAGRGVVLDLRKPDGRATSLRCTTADAPGLERLNDADRGRVRSALLTLNRPPPTTAA